MSLQRFSLSDIPATPWKNGGGTTQEIAAFPPGSDLDHFRWRVSIATIAASGPFSVYRNIDRSIMLLNGDGVHLRSADGIIDHRLDTPHQPFAFSGDAAIDGVMLGGPSRDFNVMSRRGRGASQLQIAKSSTVLGASRCGVALCLNGRWTSESFELNAGDGLRWLNTPSAPERLAPATTGAALALAIWQPAEL